MVLPTIQRERGKKLWKNFSIKYSTETMSKLAPVVYLILPA